MTRRVPRVLSVAGTDPTGGAGVQADLKSIAALGGYGMAVVTGLVAQNTQGVRETHVPPADFLRAQLDSVTDDVTVDALKIGMLGDRTTVAVVHAWLAQQRDSGFDGPVVLDPVMVSTSGHRLLAQDAVAAVGELARVADLLTPNLDELALLAGESTLEDEAAAVGAAAAVARRAGALVLVKGGHAAGAEASDVLVGRDGEVVTRVSDPRVETTSTHGTGCSLSSALATAQARVDDWPTALRIAKRWLTGALQHADELEVGHGHGPVHHGHHLEDAVQDYLDSAARSG